MLLIDKIIRCIQKLSNNDAIINPNRYRSLAHPLKLRHNQSPGQEFESLKSISHENIAKSFKNERQIYGIFAGVF